MACNARRLRGRIIVGLAVALLTVACGGQPGAGRAAAPGTRTVQHSAGTTEVPVAPTRVVSLDDSVTAYLVALGLTPVGAPNELRAQLDPVAELLPPGTDLDSVALIGDSGEPSLEASAALAPELIVGTDVHLDLYGRLSQIAPTVLVEWGSNGGWRPRFLSVADAVGRPERAGEVEAGYEAVLAGLPDAVRGVTVAFIRPQDDGQFRIDSTGEAFPGSVATDAGIPILGAPAGVGERDAGSGFVTVSGERLEVVAGADLIVVPDFRASGDQNDSVTQFERNALWRQLPAVRAGRVLQVPGLVYNGGHHYAAQTLLREIVEGVT